MTASVKNSLRRTLRPLALALLPLAVPLLAAAADQPASFGADHGGYNPPGRGDSSTLERKVQRAAGRFSDINSVIGNPDWVRATPCVSGPNEGAMGVHFIKLAILHDGVTDANDPEALIYEPIGNGFYRLVGVEFIAIASEWAEKHKDTGPASGVVDDHLMNYVGQPNRYGLPDFYELHVWAFKDKPKGTFADWNTTVTCDKAKPPVS